MNKEAIERLEKDLHGRLIRPQDKAYDDARRVWNGLIDKRPALIVQCVDDSDVVHAVNFARGHNVLVSVRGGGHNVAGFATCDEGLVIDLSGMKGERFLQFNARVTDVAEPQPLILFETALQQANHSGRCRREQRAPVWGALENGGNCIRRSLSEKGATARQELVEKTPECPDIGPLIDRMPARLLRTHVRHGPEQYAVFAGQ